MVQSTLNISNTDTSKHSLISKKTVWNIFYDSLIFSSGYRKLLLSQSKCSGSRKFNLGYKYFEMTSDFEISRLIRQLALPKDKDLTTGKAIPGGDFYT